MVEQVSTRRYGVSHSASGYRVFSWLCEERATGWVVSDDEPDRYMRGKDAGHMRGTVEEALEREEQRLASLFDQAQGQLDRARGWVERYHEWRERRNYKENSDSI